MFNTKFHYCRRDANISDFSFDKSKFLITSIIHAVQLNVIIRSLERTNSWSCGADGLNSPTNHYWTLFQRGKISTIYQEQVVHHYIESSESQISIRYIILTPFFIWWYSGQVQVLVLTWSFSSMTILFKIGYFYCGCILSIVQSTRGSGTPIKNVRRV